MSVLPKIHNANKNLNELIASHMKDVVDSDTLSVLGCGLLSLPAELRADIFSYVLRDVRCRRPVIVWDEVCTSMIDRKPAITIAILLACRTTYEDAVPILYDNCVVELSVRSDVLDHSFPRFQASLGAVEDCFFLTRLRHIEMEISYNASDASALERVVDRIHKLATAFRRLKKLKKIDLIFFDQGSRRRNSALEAEHPADAVVEATMELECDKMVGISRNIAAKRSISAVKWKSLKEKAGEAVDGREQFREINFDYWERAFTWKN